MKTPQLLYNTHNQISFKTETMIEIELNNWYASFIFIYWGIVFLFL